MQKKALILTLLLLSSISFSSFAAENIPNNDQNPVKDTEGNSSSMEKEEKWVPKIFKDEKVNRGVVIGEKEGESSSWTSGAKGSKNRGDIVIGGKEEENTPWISGAKGSKNRGDIVIGEKEGKSPSWTSGAKGEKLTEEPRIGLKLPEIGSDSAPSIPLQERKGKERKEDIFSERQKDIRIE
jgi:hypothetical protein